jgi:hypothetical protein
VIRLRRPPHSVPVLALNPVRPDAVEAADASGLAALAPECLEHLGRLCRRDVVVLRVEDRMAAHLAGRGMGHVAPSRRSMLQARLGSSESRPPWASERHRSGFVNGEIAARRLVRIKPRLGKPWLRSRARATRLPASLPRPPCRPRFCPPLATLAPAISRHDRRLHLVERPSACAGESLKVQHPTRERRHGRHH